VSATEKSDALAAAGLDAGVVGFILGVDAAIAAGELAGVTGDLSALLGRPTAPILETLRTVG